MTWDTLMSKAIYYGLCDQGLISKRDNGFSLCYYICIRNMYNSSNLFASG